MFRFLILRHGRWYLSFKMKLEKKNAIIFSDIMKAAKWSNNFRLHGFKGNQTLISFEIRPLKKKILRSNFLCISYFTFLTQLIRNIITLVSDILTLSNGEYGKSIYLNIMKINKIFCTRRYFNTYFLKH